MALNVHIDFNVEILAEQLINDITAEWKNPFEAPLILFSDKKVEQWFRLFWLTSQQKARADASAAVMNVRTQALDSFLFSVLQNPATPYYDSIRRLTSDYLRDLLISKLSAPLDDGKPYYVSLENRDVTAYLSASGSEADSAQVDEIHLYDFAETLSKLFIDYELTRPDGYDGHEAGVISTWKKGGFFFAESARATETWQRKLYLDIIADHADDASPLLTLAEAYEKNKEDNGGVPRFFYSEQTAVYVFGFSGMGQVYRKILQDFSATHTVHIFVQGVSDFAADANPLVQKWGRFGKENVQWWKQCAHTAADVPMAGALSAASDTKRALSSDAICITACPSKIREVEYVHTKICELLKDGKAAQSDILVLAPAMSQYRTALYEVFSETNAAFPHVPFSIADVTPEESLVCLALRTLLAMLESGTLSRPAFFALVRNPLVQAVRAIQPAWVESWSAWIDDMHTYRENNVRHDWITGVRRMLLARLSNQNIAVGQGADEALYVPYHDIQSADNDSLECFVDCIDALLDFCALCDKSRFGAADLDAFQNALNGWLRYDNPGDTAFTTEQSVYREIIKEIANQHQVLESSKAAAVYKKTLFLALSDAAKNAHEGMGALFTDGITFTSFRPNRIVPAKYIFFMGLDAKSFPGTDSKNMLDLRSQQEPWLCDDCIFEKDRFAFLCQLMAAKDGFFVSYVDNDLQKDEAFYCSSVINDLIEATGYKEERIEQSRLSIDEKRAWSELYTARAERNKRNYALLKGEAAAADERSALAQTPAVADEGKTPPDTVTFSELKRFLSDPFQFRVNSLFGSSDDSSDDERLTFEPIEADNITAVRLLNQVVKNRLRDLQTGAQSGEPIPATMQAELFATNVLPQKTPFGERAVLELSGTADKVMKKLTEKDKKTGLTYIDDSTLVHIDESISLVLSSPKQWLLTGVLNLYWEKNGELFLLDIKNSASEKPDVFLLDYIGALALVAQKDTGAKLYKVHLLACDGGPVKARVPFTLSSETAISILSALYTAAFVEKYGVCIPINKIEDKAPDSLRELSETLSSDYGDWIFFKHKRMVNPLTDIGFSEQGFAGEWGEARAHQKALCVFLED